MASKKFGPPLFVPGPARRALPYGLFSVLNFENPVAPQWQIGGAEWDFFTSYDGIGSVGAPSGEAPEGSTDWKPGQPETGLPKFQADPADNPNLPDLGAASPFSVYGYAKESATASSPEELQNDALEHLAIFEEAQVSHHLWHGDIGNEPNLSTPAPTVATGGSPRLAVASLEEFIADTYGSQGVMYASRETALLAVADKALEVRGSMLVTRLGTPVVVSHRFDDGEIRASAALMGLRSEPFMSTPMDQPRRLNYDIKKNDVTAIAERTYLLGYDPTGVAAAPIS